MSCSELEFAKVIEVLQHGLNKKFPPDQIKVWFECLKDLPAEALRKAIIRYLMQGDDWPTIAKIRQMATDAIHGTAPSAGDKFDEMMDAVRKYGIYKRTEACEALSADVWRTVKALGGWEAVCDSPPDQRSNLRAQFRMAYEALKQQAEQARLLPEAVRPRITESVVERKALPATNAKPIEDRTPRPNALTFWQPRGVDDDQSNRNQYLAKADAEGRIQ